MEFEAGAAVVRERAHGACEVCRAPGTQTHHRQPRGMGGVHGAGKRVNEPDNLLRLCTLCHRTIESEREWAYSMGYLVSRPQDPGTVPVFIRSVNGTGWFLLHKDGCIQWVDLPEPVEVRRRTAQ